DEVYFTAAAGPTSHSPPPIEVAAMIAPGPITRSMLPKLNGGGAGSSAVSHGGSSPCGGRVRRFRVVAVSVVAMVHPGVSGCRSLAGTLAAPRPPGPQSRLPGPGAGSGLTRKTKADAVMCLPPWEATKRYAG